MNVVLDIFRSSGHSVLEERDSNSANLITTLTIRERPQFWAQDAQLWDQRKYSTIVDL
jgi:hypothetical protein